MVFGLDVRLGDRSQIIHVVFGFADLIRLNVLFKDAAHSEITFVSASPGFVIAIGIAICRRIFLALENIVVITHGDNVTGIFERAVFQPRSIQAKTLGAAFLMGTREQLPLAVQRIVPSIVEFIAPCSAFDDEPCLTVIVADEHICPPAACAMPHPPARFEFDVLWLVAFFQQATHTLKGHKVSYGFKIAYLTLVNF